MAIHTKADREEFVAQVQAWEHDTRAGVGLQRSQTRPQSVARGVGNYLDDPAIPKSTNALEGISLD